MKKLIIAAMLLTTTAFAQPRIADPTCQKTPDGQTVLYFDSLGHVFAYFCINAKGLNTPEACRAYQDQQGREAIIAELSAFMEAEKKKRCGE
jgi:hypothetical protein